MNDPFKLNDKITLQTLKQLKAQHVKITFLILSLHTRKIISNISQFLKQLRLAMQQNERLASQPSDLYKNRTLNIKSTVWQTMGL